MEEFADFLQLDLLQESHLAWIVDEGLTCPGPKGWKPCRTPEGDTYFFNFDTGDSLWDHPCDEDFKELYETEKLKPKEGYDPLDSLFYTDEAAFPRKPGFQQAKAALLAERSGNYSYAW